MTDITVDFTRREGAVKPVHGVNNGPVGSGTLLNVSHHYKALKIPSVRLHDPNWPHPREVDIPQIFPDFDKDPQDPASYDFRRTDDYIQSILETGADIVYRLGTSIEHTKRKYYTDPPKDFDKWAAVCLGIVRHYNEGWAAGFHYGLKYWEIWNEPDNTDGACMWSGTMEQYFDLYETTARVLKDHDDTLKVGGFAATILQGDFTHQFLERCKQKNLPLDFFSWHTYAAHPSQIAENASAAREMLDSYGFIKTESHLNEWNLFPGDWTRAFSREGEECYKEEIFERLKGMEGASFTAATLMLLQEHPIDTANYYDGQPASWFCGLFNVYGVPQKTYYAFHAFKQLLDAGTKVKTNITPGNDGLYACSAINNTGNGGCVLITNFSAVSKTYSIQLIAPPLNSNDGAVLYRLKDGNNETGTPLQLSSSSEAVVEIYLGRHDVILLKF